RPGGEVDDADRLAGFPRAAKSRQVRDRRPGVQERRVDPANETQAVKERGRVGIGRVHPLGFAMALFEKRHRAARLTARWLCSVAGSAEISRSLSRARRLLGAGSRPSSGSGSGSRPRLTGRGFVVATLVGVVVIEDFFRAREEALRFVDVALEL